MMLNLEFVEIVHFRGLTEKRFPYTPFFSPTTSGKEFFFIKSASEKLESLG